MAISELCREHRLLLDRAAALRDIAAGEYPDPAAVAATRWQMAQALLDHCTREDRIVYDRLMASGDATATALAWQYRQEYGCLGERFARYIGDWPVDRIAREWLAFRADTKEITALLARRIESEEAVLYVHADRIMARHAA